MFYTCSKTRPFQHCKTLLFDGESGLKSKSSQNRIFVLYGIRVKAQAGWKRLSAERYIKEVKLRTALALELQGRKKLKTCSFDKIV